MPQRVLVKRSQPVRVGRGQAISPLLRDRTSGPRRARTGRTGTVSIDSPTSLEVKLTPHPTARTPTPARARALAESRGAGRRYRRETETLSEYEAALTRLPRNAST
jgi:hypothetical protein